MSFCKAHKAGVLFLTGLLFCFTQVGDAAAQTNTNREVMNRLTQIERQIQTMSRAVFRGDKDAAQSLLAHGENAELAGFESRLSQIEQDQRKLVNQFERMQYELRQLKDKVQLMQADAEQHLQKPRSLRYMPTATMEEKQPEVVRSSGSLAPSEVSTPTNITGSGESPALAKEHTLGTWSPSQGHRGEPEKMYEDAFQHIKEAEYDEAEKGFMAFLQKYPDHPLSPNSQYWLGETYYVRGDYKLAAKSFAKGYQKFPKSAKAQDSLLKLSLSLAGMGKKDDACLSLRQLLREGANPNHPVLKRASREIQRLNCQ